ncbi:MAG TPA: hypothetical protein VKA78_10815 [Pyrinomonadaceae bacterium]|nr:hypothetical protein [Pyrinomonadaceae bacterium]
MATIPPPLLRELVTASVPSGGASKLRWQVPDQLGSPRLILDNAGNVISRHDYLPFGEEIGSTIGG